MQQAGFELCIFATESAAYHTLGRFKTLTAALDAARQDAIARNIPAFRIIPAPQHFLDYMSNDYRKRFVAGLVINAGRMVMWQALVVDLSA